jgi:predicted phosphoribosyltransferase
VDEKGWTYVPDWVRDLGVDDEYLEDEKQVQLHELRERRRLYTPWRTATDARGRVAIVIDDGLATGATMLAALHAVRQASPAKLVCAVPVASREALALVRGMADRTVCLAAPVEFGGVARFYHDFTQVSDAEAARALRGNGRDRARLTAIRETP